VGARGVVTPAGHGAGQVLHVGSGLLTECCVPLSLTSSDSLLDLREERRR